jgi:glycopeptide antibiotics resistance protein
MDNNTPSSGAVRSGLCVAASRLARMSYPARPLPPLPDAHVPAPLPVAEVPAPLLEGSDSGRQLGIAVLAYLVATTLLITWAPFDFAWQPAYALTTVWTWSDLVLNVVMFVPLGFFFQSAHARSGAHAWWVVGLLGAALSAGIEGGQLFLASRYTSHLDVVTNGLGAALGARVFELLRPRIRVGSGAVSALALELPLTGLVMLLVPLLWVFGFASAGSARLWLLLPVATFGGAVLGAVHGAYLEPSTRAGRGALALVVAGWFLVAALPGAATHWEVLLTGVAVAVGAAVLRSLAASRARARDGAQRVELPTLRLVLPLFASYVTLASLWPFSAVDGVWRGGWALAPARDGLSRVLLMQSLEYLAAFTVVGYITAELHGRRNVSYAEAWPRVLRRAGALVLLLECARGWNSTIGASGALALLAIGAGLFGGWLYHLQRDHVRTLLARPVPFALRAVAGRRVQPMASGESASRTT